MYGSQIPDDIEGKDLAVLFSGGRDSTLAACRLAYRGAQIHLLTGFSGLGIGSEIVNVRVREMRKHFGNSIVAWETLDIRGLVGAIAFRNIEEDFRIFDTNLVLLGEKLALHTEATRYCLNLEISYLADGTSGYQSDLPEQMPEAVSIFGEFAHEYDIQYLTPIIEYKSEEQVKDELFMLGLSTKSIEAISMFSDSFTLPDKGISEKYLRSKIKICNDYLDIKKLHNRYKQT